MSIIIAEKENVRHLLRRMVTAAVKAVAITIAMSNLTAKTLAAAGGGRTTLHVEEKKTIVNHRCGDTI